MVSRSKEDSNCDEVKVTSLQSLFHELGFNVEVDAQDHWMAWKWSRCADFNRFTNLRFGLQIVCIIRTSNQLGRRARKSWRTQCHMLHQLASSNYAWCGWNTNQKHQHNIHDIVLKMSVLRQLHTLSASKRMYSMRQSKLSTYVLHTTGLDV